MKKVGELDSGIAGVLTRLTQRFMYSCVSELEHIHIKHDEGNLKVSSHQIRLGCNCKWYGQQKLVEWQGQKGTQIK